VTFVASTPGRARTETRSGFTVHLLHSHYAARWQAWFGLLNPQTLRPLNLLLRKLRPDVVNAHNVHMHLGYHSLVIARFTGAATVFTAHDVMPFAYAKYTAYIDPTRRDPCATPDYRLPFGYNARQMRLRWNPARNLSIRHTMVYYADARIAVSGELKKALEANRLPPFEVVHNAVDPAAYDVPEGSVDVLRQRLRLEGRRVILYGGRLSREKGEEQLLAALRRVRRDVPKVALLVLAHSADSILTLMHRHADLRGSIIYGGWLEGPELAAAYRAAQVVATPSICFESFGVMNLEGMAAGAVPITTCFGGPREAVLDGETGYVVNPFDTEALADRLSRLLTDDDLRQRMARAGRRRVEEHFTVGQQTAKALAIFERVLAKRRRKRGLA
jgi:glycosyltransferase involved in cell wall biosynthesis